MNARRLIHAALVITLACVSGTSLDARDLRPELIVNGRVKGMSISPSGDLWIGTATGYAYRSADGGRTWSEAEVTPRRMVPPDSWRGDTLDRLTFFDARRAMFSGYIGDANDIILVTDDAGATWETVRLPVQGLWVYDAQVTSDGHAWLVGSSGAVLRSDDYGRTWRELARPFDSSERTMSVWFDSPLVGFVGALFKGSLAMTTDGGASWKEFEAVGRDEVVRGCESTSDQRLNKVRVSGDRVVIEQCGGVFTSPIAAPRAWTRMTAGGKPLVDFELADDGKILAVAEEGDVWEVSIDGRSRSLGMRVPRLPMSLAVSGKRIALLDSTHALSVFDGESWFTSRLFGEGVAASWPIQALDRGEDDLLWGISSFFLYRSTDGAKTWDRIVELPASADRVFLQADGNVLLSDGHGWVGRWDVSTSQLVEVPVLNGLDIVGSFRRADLWLVFGGRQYDTAGRVEVAQSFFAGQFAGSIDSGFVAASVDGGRTWTIIDRWKEEGPQRAFLSDDNRLTLLSWLGGIRQGNITREPLGANMQTLLRGDDREKAPYVQSAHVLDLLDGSRGWILGWIHHIGVRAYRTSDGGRSWKPAGVNEYPRTALVRLFDGTWIGVAPPLLQRWTGKKFEKFVTVPGQITEAWVDSRGSLSLRLKDGAIQVLDRDKGALRVVGQAPTQVVR